MAAPRVSRQARAQAVLEYRKRQRATLENLSTEAIPDDMSFRAWCEMLARPELDKNGRLIRSGLLVDGKPFTLDDRPAMAWIYDQIPTTRDEAYRYILVLMKCAQVGFTVMEMLACIYLGLKFGPATVGMFLPDMRLTQIKSAERFVPVVRSIPSVHALMRRVEDGDGKAKGTEGNVYLRRLGKALYVFSWTSGRATTESVPMDVLSFDEVQEMSLDQMEKTLERLSASEVRFVLMGSTANWPEADIHHWYLRGTRHQFHTECQTCGARKPLDDYFPDCIKFDPERDTYRYVCPNGHWISDTQHGEWVPELPDRDPGPQLHIPKRERKLRIRSIHFPQYLSPTITAEEIMTSYQSATDMKNFTNRKRGKPFLDPSLVPVSLEHLHACVEAGRAAGIVWKQRARGCFMGIDQMGMFNVVVVKERLADGRQALVHVEEIYSDDPFARCDELMVNFGIVCCVGEINPNYNDMKRFANRHKGKVFICDSFGQLSEEMIQWGDGPRVDTSDRRTSEEERDRYTLKMDQYKCMQVSMARITSAKLLMPDPQGLVQEVVDKGKRFMAPVLPRMFNHLTKTALVAEKDEETNKYKRSVKKIGIDPHFSYANMLCDVAWSRAHGTSTFVFADPVEPVSLPGGNGAAAVAPEAMRALLNQGRADAAAVCGRCISFYGGRCQERGFTVKESDPGCDLFIAIDS